LYALRDDAEHLPCVGMYQSVRGDEVEHLIPQVFLLSSCRLVVEVVQKVTEHLPRWTQPCPLLPMRSWCASRTMHSMLLAFLRAPSSSGTRDLLLLSRGTALSPCPFRRRDSGYEGLRASPA
jgi:hypothetical protein